jgi:hypothetical protein
MRLAAIFILAFVVSAIAGMLAFVATSYLPNWDDPAGHGLGEAFRALLTAVYVILSVVLYGLAFWRSNRQRHLKRALYILLLVPFLIMVLGVVDNGIHHMQWLREAVDMVQMFMPLWSIALVQWLILHIYISVAADRSCESRLRMNLHINIANPKIDADAARRWRALTGA